MPDFYLNIEIKMLLENKAMSSPILTVLLFYIMNEISS